MPPTAVTVKRKPTFLDFSIFQKFQLRHRQYTGENVTEVNLRCTTAISCLNVKSEHRFMMWFKAILLLRTCYFGAALLASFPVMVIHSWLSNYSHIMLSLLWICAEHPTSRVRCCMLIWTSISTNAFLWPYDATTTLLPTPHANVHPYMTFIPLCSFYKNGEATPGKTPALRTGNMTNKNFTWHHRLEAVRYIGVQKYG
jgi:hypothetical protein